MTSQGPSPNIKANSAPNAETFRLLFANHPIPMWIYDLKTLAFLDVNDAALEKYGYKREEFLALTIKDIRPLEDVTRLLKDVKQKRPALQHSGQWQHRIKDGRLIDVEITSHTIEVNGRQAVLVMAQNVTERKRAEETLNESEKRFRALIENSSDAITLLDAKGIAMYDSPAAPGMLGYAPEDWIGRDVFALIHPDDLPKMRDLFQNLVETPGARANSTFRVHHKSGSWLWIEMVATNLLSEPSVKAIVLNYHDITQRVQAEEALRESEDKFRHVFDHSASGKSITLPSGEINVNRAFCEMLGYSQEELNSRKWQEISHPDDLELTQNMVNSLLSGEKEAVLFTKRYIHKNGSTVWADVGTALRRDQDGNPLYFMTTISDITARKQAEEALQAAKEYAENLIETANTIVVGLDIHSNITVFNKAAEAITGYTRSDLQDRNWFEVIVPKNRYPQVWAEFKRLTMDGIVKNYENPILTKTGEERYIVWQNNEVFENGKIVGTISFGMDITERRQAEEKIRQLNAELEKRVEERTRELREAQEQLVRQEKLAVLGQLAGGVGHELRNPLAVINNAVYYLKLVQPDADKKIKEYLSMIERETHTAEKIITDLLDFARIKSVDQEPVSISELVQRVLARYPAPSSVAVSLDFPPDLPQVFADPHQMEQVLGNLVVNACQAMASGGKLKISAVHRKDELAIAVSDTGVGIPPENMGEIFEPLFTTKPKGIGLGLAVSKKLAEANGGRLEVQSEPGKGSTFTLVLPAHDG